MTEVVSNARDHITQSILKENLHYAPLTGVFTWVSSRRYRLVGTEAGCRNARGYRFIGLFGLSCLAHRLAFLYMNGDWPKRHVDHKNGDKMDNRWSNLRECTHAENCQNKSARSRGTSSHIGVCWYAKIGKWRASIGVNGVTKYLGDFHAESEAVDAYVAAKLENHHFQGGLRP